MKTVVHYKHTFLNPSETFIRTQMKSITGFRSLGLSARYLDNPVTEGLETTFIPPVDLKLHKAFRIMPFTAVKLSGEKPVLIHAHFGKNGWRAVNLSRLLRIPLITSFHGRDATAVPKDPVWRKKYSVLFRRASRILVLSDHMKKLLMNIGCPEEKIVIHPLGIDTRSKHFRPSLPPDEGTATRLLFTGRFSEKKGIPTALKALQSLGNSTLTFIGGGSMETGFRALAEDLGVADRVTFAGWKTSSEVMAEMQKAHILLVPSDTAPDGDMEGAPTVIYEAMASGLPVVGTYHAGIPEQIENRQSGMLIEEKDHHGLAQAVRELSRSSDLYNSIALNARKRAEDLFDSSRQATRLEAIYRDVTAKA